MRNGRSRKHGVTRIAALDIGTNTILLLIADLDERGEISPIREMERTTRLGQGLTQTRRLRSDSIRASLRVIHEYLALCKNLNVDRVRLAGTSALREAQNADEFVDAVYRRSGLRVEILSGAEEARLSFLAVQRDLGRGEPVLVLDIGGGSTELIEGRGEDVTKVYSLDLGAVRLTERYLLSDPAKDDEFGHMTDHITETFRCLSIHPPPLIVGLGGTITALSAVRFGENPMDPARIHGSALWRHDVEQQVLVYRRTTLCQRLRIPGLPQERADVILAGSAILLGAMETLGFDRLRVSCRGLRYGLIYAAFQGEHIEKGEKPC